MTDKFESLLESLLKEVLIGTQKRNKLRDLNHITPTPRILNNPSHIRPINKSIGNETGVHSKRPDSKPVYHKNGIKPNKNKSQRPLSNKTPYSARHDKAGTKRNLMARREKLLKTLYKEGTEAEEGFYVLYKITTDRNDRSVEFGDVLYYGIDVASKKAKILKDRLKTDIIVLRTKVFTDKDHPNLETGIDTNEFIYKGSRVLNSEYVIAFEYEDWLK